MSTAAVSSSFLPQQVQQYFQTRNSDLQKLGEALASGDLSAAQQEFSTIQSLASSGPVSGGNEFFVSQRQQDFNAIGQALQSGDLNSAQQGFAQLQSTFLRAQSQDPTSDSVNLSAAATAASAGSTSAAAGSEIVLNLGSLTPGEQITIGVSNSGNGTDQVAIGIGPLNQAPQQQIGFNLNQSGNQEIILNLLNSASSTGSTTSGSGVSVTA